ncbi:MAG TPA: M14 family zinc carboxypeptidase [Blastocatellia bacterium]|nr:M14 family zinc carboxypeptidase [Blastocatellia bacterium]
MPIPDRINPEDYHYHVYDYDNSAPFALSDAMGLHNLRCYSLVLDLIYLAGEAMDKKIPNTALFPLVPYTAENRKIYVLHFGGDPNRRVLFTGGIHGRERIAVEIPYLIAEYLIKNYPDPADEKPSAKQQEIKNLVDNSQIFVAPMLNPDGHNYATKTDRMWRINRRILTAKNDFTEENEFSKEQWGYCQYFARQYKTPPEKKNDLIDGRNRYYFHPSQASAGVDLNRNFPGYMWGYETYGKGVDDKGEKVSFHATSGDPTVSKRHESYFGPAKNSEYETKAIMDLFTRFGPFLASIDYHSYSKMILYPELAKNDANVVRMAQCMRELTKIGKESKYKCGRPSDLLYPGFSSLMDYSYKRAPTGPSARKPYAFTIELDPEYGNEAVGFDLPEGEILNTFRKNIRGALALIACAGKDIDRDRTPLCCGQFADWQVFNRGNILPD